MSMKLTADVEALTARVKALEEAFAAKVGAAVASVEHATKDDIDALLGRLRALEGAIGRKGK